MDIAKEKAKLLKTANKLHDDKLAYIERVKDENKKNMQKVLTDAGADGLDIPVNDRLDVDVLITLERQFNEPRAFLLERIRQLENVEKKQRSDDIPAQVEKLDAVIADLKSKLQAKESERAGLLDEKKNIDHNLEYRGGSKGAITYQRVAHLMQDERVNPTAKQGHYSYILNF